MQELTLLHNRLDKLLKQYVALQQDNESLLATLRQQNDSLDKLNRKVADLEDQLVIAKTAEVISGKDDKTAVRKQLNTLIGDIDKLLGSLND